MILIWERQFVFAARAYLATRRGDAAAAATAATAAAASAMHHGAARIEGYDVAVPGVREDRVAEVGSTTEERVRGRNARRLRERERKGDRMVPRHTGRSPTPKGRPTAWTIVPPVARYQTPSTGSTNITSSLRLLPTHPFLPSVLADRLVLHHRRHQPPL